MKAVDERLNKADRLSIAAYSAPRLRAAHPRRIKVVDSSGNVVREATTLDLASKILERAEIEFDVEPGKKRTRITCACGRIFSIQESKKGVTKLCAACRNQVCSQCGMKTTTKGVARAQSNTGLCRDCYLLRGPSPGKGKCVVCGGTAAKRSGGGYALRCSDHPYDRKLAASQVARKCGRSR